MNVKNGYGIIGVRININIWTIGEVIKAAIKFIGYTRWKGKHAPEVRLEIKIRSGLEINSKINLTGYEGV